MEPFKVLKNVFSQAVFNFDSTIVQWFDLVQRELQIFLPHVHFNWEIAVFLFLCEWFILASSWVVDVGKRWFMYFWAVFESKSDDSLLSCFL